MQQALWPSNEVAQGQNLKESSAKMVLFGMLLLLLFIWKQRDIQLEWEEENKNTEKENNYAGGQIEKHLHPEKIKKFKLGESIRTKSLKKMDYGMMDGQNQLIGKINCTM